MLLVSRICLSNIISPADKSQDQKWDPRLHEASRETTLYAHVLRNGSVFLGFSDLSSEGEAHKGKPCYITDTPPTLRIWNRDGETAANKHLQSHRSYIIISKPVEAIQSVIHMSLNAFSPRTWNVILKCRNSCKDINRSFRSALIQLIHVERRSNCWPPLRKSIHN